MALYIIGIFLICLGFLMPPYGGIEFIFIVLGAYLFFKKFNEDTNLEKK